MTEGEERGERRERREKREEGRGERREEGGERPRAGGAVRRRCSQGQPQAVPRAATRSARVGIHRAKIFFGGCAPRPCLREHKLRASTEGQVLKQRSQATCVDVNDVSARAVVTG